MATSNPFNHVFARNLMRLASPANLDSTLVPAHRAQGDEAWLAALEAGDDAALTRLYREHHAPVRALVRRLMSRSGDVEDVVHDVFVSAPTAFKNYRGQGSVRSFVFSIAVHQVRHHLRASGRRRAWIDRFRLSAAPPPAPVTPEAASAQRELKDRLSRALDALSFEHKSAVVLCEVEEMTSVEAARVLGVPEATVRTRLHHAKKKLRDLLEGESPVTDQRLDEALRALRTEVGGDSPDAEATLARVLSTNRAKAQRTRRTWMYLLPIAAVLAATSSWAAATGRIASMWSAPNAPDRVAVNDPPAPSAAVRGEVAPGNATTTADPLAADEAPAAPAKDDDEAPVAAPADEARATDDKVATRGGAVATPSEAAERSRKARGEPVARTDASAAAAPSATAAAPSASADPESKPNPLAEDKADFQAAYRVHASGAAGAAVDAWNGYLSKHPAGRFVPEARYARAVALVRSGQLAAARDALRAFANGPPGSYRRDDAQKLLATIGEK